MSNISPELLEDLACPQCRAKLALDYEGSELVCTNASCGHAYPILDGIPVMLIDQARVAG